MALKMMVVYYRRSITAFRSVSSFSSYSSVRATRSDYIPDGDIRIMVDGSVRKVRGVDRAGCGGVFVNSYGEYVTGFQENLTGLYDTIEECEARAYLVSLRIAGERKMYSIQIEIDSRKIYGYIRDRPEYWKDKNFEKVKGILDEIVEEEDSMEKAGHMNTRLWTKRMNMLCADWMAVRAAKSNLGGRIRMFDEKPTDISFEKRWNSDLARFKKE